MKRFVTVALSGFAHDALAGEESDEPPHVASRLEKAIRVYLADEGAGRPGWEYPSFLRGQPDEPRDARELKLAIDEDVWRALEGLAEAQGVSARRLAEHAALYHAAAADAGRVTERILEDEGRGGVEGTAA